MALLVVCATLTVVAGLTGWATALADRPPLAAIVARANAPALRAMVNLDVDVRFSDRNEDKVSFRPGTLGRAQLSPGRLPGRLTNSLCRPGSGVPDASQVQGDELVTQGNPSRTRGAFVLLPCPMFWA